MISHWIKSVKSQVLYYPYVPTNGRSKNPCVQRINRETKKKLKKTLRRLESITVITSTWTCAYRNVNSNINVNDSRITRSYPIKALRHWFTPAILELYLFFSSSFNSANVWDKRITKVWLLADFFSVHILMDENFGRCISVCLMNKRWQNINNIKLLRSFYSR